MVAELVISAVAVSAIIITVRYHWITRRQPVRPDAPTGPKAWVPARHHRDDETPVYSKLPRNRDGGQAPPPG